MLERTFLSKRSVDVLPLNLAKPAIVLYSYSRSAVIAWDRSTTLTHHATSPRLSFHILKGVTIVITPPAFRSNPNQSHSRRAQKQNMQKVKTTTDQLLVKPTDRKAFLYSERVKNPQQTRPHRSSNLQSEHGGDTSKAGTDVWQAQ